MKKMNEEDQLRALHLINQLGTDRENLAETMAATIARMFESLANSNPEIAISLWEQLEPQVDLDALEESVTRRREAIGIDEDGNYDA